MNKKLKKNTKLIDGYTSFDSNLLINRGIDTKEDADKFFNQGFDDLGNYWDIRDFKETVYFIKSCIDKGLKICIFGDYDVDGITSTDVLYEGFRELGANVSYRLPCRIKEGYGIKLSAVKELIKQGYEVIVTIDNGIRAIEPIKYAREHGVDVVVLDHHIPGKELPMANYIIDLHREDETYPYREFAGCGVAFMVMRGLYFLYGYDDDFCKRHLDVVAIGTIADVMKLTGENRILVKEGLAMINDTINYRHFGILALIKTQCITKKLTAKDIGYSIAPCFNAPGRLLEDGANYGLELLLSNNMQDALKQAGYICSINEMRKTMEHNATLNAFDYIEKHNMQNNNIIIVFQDGLPEGLIGLVSGRITSKYNRPSIVFTKNARGNWKASARSIKSIDLFECLCSCDCLFVGYGGHEQAAGLEIKPEDFDTLNTALNEFIEDNYDKSAFDIENVYEGELDVDEINNTFFDKLEKYEPCGEENPLPVFFIKEFNSVKRKIPHQQDITHYQLYGDGGEHFKLFGERFDLQGFRLGEKFKELGCPTSVSCLVTIEKSTLTGEDKIVLNAIDIDEPVVKQHIEKNTSVLNEIQNLANLL